MRWSDVREFAVAAALAIGGLLLALVFLCFAVLVMVGIPVAVVAGVVWAVILVLQNTGVM